MPVLSIVCPDCRHEYRSLVLEGAKVPAVWVCPECTGRRLTGTGSRSPTIRQTGRLSPASK